MGRLMQMTGVVAAITALFGMAGVPAAAAEPGSFSGSCELTGLGFFDPPLKAQARQTRFRWEPGFVHRCSGSLNGSDVRSAPMKLNVAGQGMLGCAYSDATGTGTMRFTRGTAAEVDDVLLPVSLDLRGGSSEWYARLRGVNAGALEGWFSLIVRGEASYYNIDQCTSDDPTVGVREWSFRLDAQTAAPLVSPMSPVEALHARLGLPRSITRPQARRRGLSVRLQTNAPVAGTVTLTHGAKTLAVRTVKLQSALGGRIRVRLPLKLAVRTLLRGRRHASITVTADVKHAFGAHAQTTATVLLRR